MDNTSINGSYIDLSFFSNISGDVTAYAKLVKIIDNGYYGPLCLGLLQNADDPKNKDLPKKFAVKILPVQINTEESLSSVLESDIQRLIHLNHPNIEKVFGRSTFKNDAPTIVKEYINGLSLYNFIHESKALELMKLDDRLKMAIQITSGLDYLQQNNIICKTVRSADIMVDINNSNIPKICDYGFATIKETTKLNIISTCRWRAPETYYSFKNRKMTHGVSTHKTMTFSLGMIMYEIFTQRIPFYELKDTCDAGIAIKNGSSLTAHDSLFTSQKMKDIYGLILCCTQLNAENRPTLSQCKIILDNLLRDVDIRNGHDYLFIV